PCPASTTRRNPSLRTTGGVHSSVDLVSLVSISSDPHSCLAIPPAPSSEAAVRNRPGGQGISLDAPPISLASNRIRSGVLISSLSDTRNIRPPAFGCQQQR